MTDIIPIEITDIINNLLNNIKIEKESVYKKSKKSRIILRRKKNKFKT